MSGSFIDSNVFVYLVDETDARKRNLAADLIRSSIMNGSGTISHQVIQEVLSVITRKIAQPVSREDAQRYLDEVLVPLWRVMPTPDLYRDALNISSRYQYDFYDALIIAAALADGCSSLYSEDFQSGQRIEGLTIINPFEVHPEVN